jgi:hypothetical protein
MRGLENTRRQQEPIKRKAKRIADPMGILIS